MEAYANVLDGYIRDIDVLISYYALRSRAQAEKFFDVSRRNNWSVFLDSGAFSAMTQNVEIDIDEYSKFCLLYEDECEFICSLDVIGDYHNSKKNYLYMRDVKNVDCIPVFHVNSPFSALIDLVSDVDNYIAFGVAGNQTLTRALNAWIIKCFEIVGTNKKVHGFGLTSWKIMQNYIWYSVDSTTWISAGKYAEIIVHVPGSLVRVRRSKDQYVNLIKTISKSTYQDVDPRSLIVARKATLNEYRPILLYNMKSFINFCAELDTRRNRGI